MKMAKNLVAAMATAALATSMVCIAPAASMAQSTPAATTASGTYTAMAKAKKISMTVGEKKKLSAKGKVISWKSSKKSVATVSKKGVVTAKKAGTTTITAKTKKGSTKYSLTVAKPAVDLAAYLDALREVVVASGIEGADKYGDPLYTLPLNEDGSLGVIYYEGDEAFTVVDAVDDNTSVQLIFDLEPGTIANVNVLEGSKVYQAAAKTATYKQGVELTWRDITTYSKPIDIDKTEGAKLTAMAEQSIFKNMGPALAEFGFQLNQLVFPNVSDF